MNRSQVLRWRYAVIKKLMFFIFFSCVLFYPCTSSSTARNEPIAEITVVKGDYLIKICEQYLEDPGKWPEIARFNNLQNPDLIYPNQIISIPERLLRGIPLDGVVSFLKGRVEYQPKNSQAWKTLALHDRVPEGSKIRTASESAVEIIFENGDSCYQRADTTVGISMARRKGTLNVHKLFLESGKAVTKIREATGRESRFEIHTPSAICAARGTEFRTSVDLNDTTRSEVIQGTTSVEAMKKRIEVSEGEGTMVEKGMPPHEPVQLLSPPILLEKIPVYKKMPVRLAFEEMEKAVVQRVIIARARDCRDVLNEKIIVPGGPFEITEIEDGTYFVQSLYIDELGLEGMPSDPVEITVRVNPVPPYINIPEDRAEYRERTVQCKWLKVKDAASYHVQIAEDARFEKMVEDRPDIKDSECVIRNLGFKTYFFRICSVAHDGFEGGWSDIIQFSIVPPPLAPPVEKPQIRKEEVSIRWKDLGEGFAYHFQMAGTEQFIDIIVDRIVDSPEITIQRPKESGRYFVRTSAIDREKYEGDFGKPQSFEVKRFPYSMIGVIGAFIWIVFFIP